MNSLSRIRWPVLLTAVVAVSGLASCWFFVPQPTRGAAALPAAKGIVIYDPDPGHLWNRLHHALRAMIAVAKTNDPEELDPFVRRYDEYVFNGEAQKTALRVLDEFIAGDGHNLIKDPLRRAFLQRDLRTLFDSLPVPRRAAAKSNPQMELAVRLGRIISRLGLTADEIKKLPDNYAEAAAAKAAWYLPTDLWDPKGPWVLLGDKNWQLPLAGTHVEFFGGRSTFFVFLRTDGREQTLRFLDDLQKPASDSKSRPIPPGYQLALLRQMQVIDDRGALVTTKVTECLQLRGEGFGFELKLNRREFLAGKPSLKVIGENDLERAHVLLLGNNAGPGPSKIRDSCGHCHSGIGHHSVFSYHSFALLRTPRLKPELIAATRKDVETTSHFWMAQRYEWGLLQGLLHGGARD
jgi:hypothetical protein